VVDSDQLHVDQTAIDEKTKKMINLQKKLDGIDEEGNAADGGQKDSLIKRVKELEAEINKLKNPSVKNKTAICVAKENKILNALKEVKTRQSLYKPVLDHEMAKCKEEADCSLAEVNQQVAEFTEEFLSSCRNIEAIVYAAGTLDSLELFDITDPG